MASFTVTAAESEIIGRLQQESDRAVAIIGGCLVEDRVEVALRAKLREETKIENDLFGAARPLSGFSPKNDLAFLLRCYGRKLYEEITVIINIRNAFAHYYVRKGRKVEDFSSPFIAELCGRLTLLENYVLTKEEFERRHGQRKSVSEIPPGTMWADDVTPILSNYRERFITTVGLVTVHLGIYPTEDTFVRLLGDEERPSLPRRLE